MYNIPILLICFKRYEKTLEIFNSIKSARPKKLYVSIDGARNNEEKVEVDKVVSIFEDLVDWDCEVNIRRSENNQGCKYGVYNAISWFFESEEMGIILEDDILPYPQFYKYCEELLNRYKDDKRVACISGWGYFYQKEPENYPYTYYFSRIQSSWGWATWKDRWNLIDLNVNFNDFDVIENNLKNDNVDEGIIDFYKWLLHNRVDFNTAWDYQFLLSVLMKKNMYCIQPIKRFVRQLGNEDGTHPTTLNLNKSKLIESNFKLVHPNDFEYIPQIDLLRNLQTGEYKKKCCVVIITHKESLSDSEEASLKQALDVFNGKRDIKIVLPNNISYDYYESFLNRYSFEIVKVDYNWLSSYKSYEAMRCSKQFYEIFSFYDYALFYETDSWVFEDRLDEFMNMGYDYYGAAWPDINAVGNGGFNLCKIKKMIEITSKYDYTLDSSKYGADLWFCVKHGHELNICDLKTACEFSIEALYKPYFRMVEKIPMGFHGKYMRKFCWDKDGTKFLNLKKEAFYD